jgi:hypothetical protein
MDLFTIEIMLSALSLFGMALVSRHETRIFGFFICAIGNIGWIIHGININHLPYLVLFSGYLIFNSIGLHDEYTRWSKLRDYKNKFNSIDNYK